MLELFVYGTLMRGEAGHGLLRDARFVSDVLTPPRFELLDMGDYPALVEGGTTAVTGEIHAVEPQIFGVLDAYEDVPAGLYRRTGILVAERLVQTYVLSDARALDWPRIASGDWRRR